MFRKNCREKEAFLILKNIVLITRLNSSPRILQTHCWFLKTFTSKFIEFPSRDRRVTFKKPARGEHHNIRVEEFQRVGRKNL